MSKWIYSKGSKINSGQSVVLQVLDETIAPYDIIGITAVYLDADEDNTSIYTDDESNKTIKELCCERGRYDVYYTIPGFYIYSDSDDAFEFFVGLNVNARYIKYNMVGADNCAAKK